MRHPVLFLALLTLLASACSATADDPDRSDAAEVLPIDDVLASGIVVTPDPSGTSAVVTVTTSIPLACAVIYGEDQAFGAIATDDDMDGGAHRDHAPVLSGLEPSTEYRYVLQGSDAEGNLYRSDVLTFSTPAADAVDHPGENIAPTGEIAAASSEFSDAFAADHAIDGDAATAWSSAGDGDGAWITIELPEPTEVAGFGLRSRSMGDGSSIIERYEVTVDDDRVLGPFEADPDGLTVSSTPITGRRFRVDAVATTGGNTGIVEFEIYAAE